MTGMKKLGLLALALVVQSACTKVVIDTPGSTLGANLTVERFLHAANEHDVQAMGRMFGTQDGSVSETGSTFGCAFKKIGSWFGGQSCTKKTDVEIRMDAIASILEHEDYRIVDENRVAGRTAPTRRVSVDMTMRRGQSATAVPFVVVQTNNGRWLVQEVDLQRVMAAR